MTLKEKIANFEAAQRAKAAAQETSRRNEKFQYERNKAAALEWMKTIVAPILEAAAKEIRQAGYSSDVQIVAERKMNEGAGIILAEPSITLRVAPSKSGGLQHPHQLWWICAEGTGLTRSKYILASDPTPSEGAEVKIDDVDGAAVEARLAEFTDKIFPAE